MLITDYESPPVNAITIKFNESGNLEISICTNYLNIFLLSTPEFSKLLLLLTFVVKVVKVNPILQHCQY